MVRLYIFTCFSIVLLSSCGSGETDRDRLQVQYKYLRHHLDDLRKLQAWIKEAEAKWRWGVSANVFSGREVLPIIAAIATAGLDTGHWPVGDMFSNESLVSQFQRDPSKARIVYERYDWHTCYTLLLASRAGLVQLEQAKYWHYKPPMGPNEFLFYDMKLPLPQDAARKWCKKLLELARQTPRWHVQIAYVKLAATVARLGKVYKEFLPQVFSDHNLRSIVAYIIEGLTNGEPSAILSIAGPIVSVHLVDSLPHCSFLDVIIRVIPPEVRAEIKKKRDRKDFYLGATAEAQCWLLSNYEYLKWDGACWTKSKNKVRSKDEAFFNRLQKIFDSRMNDPLFFEEGGRLMPSAMEKIMKYLREGKPPQK